MKKYRLNFDFPALDMNGNPAFTYDHSTGRFTEEKIIVGKQLGNLLGNAVGIPVDKIFKHYEWGKELFRQCGEAPGSFLELDRSDFDYLKKFIQDDKNLSAAAKAQLLQVFVDAENITVSENGTVKKEVTHG